MNFKSDKVKPAIARMKGILWILGLHAFLAILVLVLVDLFIGGYVFYKYVYSAEKQAPRVTENVLKFDVKTYQSVLEELRLLEQ